MLLDILCCKWSQQNTAVGESVKVILDLLHPALKKRLQEGKPIFLPLPKKSEGLERFLRWVNACGRDKDFTGDKVTK